MDKKIQQEDFYERLEFKDRPPDDGKPGPARAVDITARCTDCWGAVSVATDDQGRWNHIECLLCGRSVDGDEAEREAAAMRHEAERNMFPARTGHPSKYRPDAKFVLKLLPDMDRNKEKVNQRIAANRAQGPKRGRLTRHEIPLGTAGYLYAQVRTLLAGVEQLPEEKSAISHADFHFVEPQISSSDWTEADGKLRLSTSVPVLFRKPSERTLMARMGTALAAGMASAFACEVGMKAVLVTRLDEAAKTHDLSELYGELPEDSQRRLEADFPSIAEVLEHSRETFGKWRYFEEGVGEGAIRTLVDTDRVWGLGKAARVIADECVVVGLNYSIDVEMALEVDWDETRREQLQEVHLRLEGGEAAVPWDDVLVSGGTRG